jgi:pimeloyl-ACP methyl ester carboxylesterase
MNDGIERCFVDALSTSLHVRWFGHGVPLLLIHQSPTSARVLEDRLRAFGDAYLCIAPDIPGMGQSGTIAEPVPSIEVLARYFLALLDELGIARALVYGAHTGALIATQMARVQPERVAGLLLDGYPIYTDEEAAQRLANYFPPLTAGWDGAHLLWLWHRYREQFLYWPWNTKSATTRASRGIPDVAHLQAGVAEMARTNDSYPSCYRAAFTYDATAALADLGVEAHFLVSDTDSLSRKLSLMQTKAGLHQIHRLSGGRDAQIAEERRILDALVQDEPSLCVVQTLQPAAVSRRRHYASSPQGHLVALRHLPGSGKPLLVLPPIPAGADYVLSLPGVADTGRALIIVDPPGVGGVPPGPAGRLDGCVAAIASEVSCIPDIDLLTFGYSSALLPGLRAAFGEALGTVIAVDPPCDTELPEPFDSTLCPSGSHLLRYWDRWRFEALFSPATARSGDAIRKGATEDLATLSRFVLSAIDALPVWQEMEGELAPLLVGRWARALRPGDHLLFNAMDSATATGLQAIVPAAAVTELTQTGQSAFGRLRGA